MKKNNLNLFLLSFAVFLFATVSSCSKSAPAPNPPADACAGKNIILTVAAQSSTGCSNDGSVTVSASGSTGFTYKLNSTGTYQASGNFTNLSTGTYTVFAKDAAGCEKFESVILNGTTTGPLFTQVRNLITARCQSCHNNSVQNGGMNFQIDCNIVANKTRIKVRAVDQGTMPTTGPLPQSEKDIITNWINAGGRLTD